MLRFVGNGDQKKFTDNPRHFAIQNPQPKPQKKIHKSLLGGGQSKNVACFGDLSVPLSRDLRSNLVRYPSLARYPEETRIKCDDPSLAEPLCCDNPLFRVPEVGIVAAIVCDTLKKLELHKWGLRDGGLRKSEDT